MHTDERALAFRCHGDWLYGVASLPAAPCRRGVLIVVGGPQYRAGSHRQFTLLARELAAQGVAAMRFDYRGMGDSDGDARDFEAVGDDLRAALDAFMAVAPGLQEVVLWGLCDAASAALLYAAKDARVSGLVLLNPWVRTAEGIARTTLKHYYRRRLMEPALWRLVLRGRFDFLASARSMVQLVRAALGACSGAAAATAPTTPTTPTTTTPTTTAPATIAPTLPLPQRMYEGLRQFSGQVLVITSGADLTAQEFCDMAAASGKWRRLLGAARVTHRQLPLADHTFSRRAWRDQVAAWSAAWVRSW